MQGELSCDGSDAFYIETRLIRRNNVSAITELAERLGKAIAQSRQASDLQAARDAMAKEPETEKLLNEFHEHSEKLAALEARNKPVEVDDKHKLQEMHGKLIASETFKKFTAAQVEYIDLMRKVNQAIQRQIAEAEKPA